MTIPKKHKPTHVHMKKKFLYSMPSNSQQLHGMIQMLILENIASIKRNKKKIISLVHISQIYRALLKW